MEKMIGSTARHAVTAGGVMVGAEGVGSDDWRVALIGAVVTMFGMYMSYLEKRERP